MRDWSKPGQGALCTTYGSYVYDSEINEVDKGAPHRKKLLLFKNTIPGHDKKSLLMIVDEGPVSSQKETLIEIANSDLKKLAMIFRRL